MNGEATSVSSLIIETELNPSLQRLVRVSSPSRAKVLLPSALV